MDYPTLDAYGKRAETHENEDDSIELGTMDSHQQDSRSNLDQSNLDLIGKQNK